MNDQPSYYSIITANVRYDNRLTDSEKLLFAEITSLSNKYGYCSASNGYFAKLYEVTKITVSRRIKNLKKCGYLKVEIVREGNEIKLRKLYPLTEMLRPINTNDKENITSNNTINNNTTSINDNSATDVTREQFEEWWQLYDKKLDKKKAASLFKSALKKHDFETIMNGTREYLKTITNKQYQKYPKTFLNQESYLNDFQEETVPSGMDQLERMKHDPSYWD
ncbi:helix-turn-helix domain-containing protein [Staphylococcus simulans]|uniref:helix-turn-helix domain-containing protein n=1 Tax=Staphylococcus simulans TaxID=1286 RepID=UPI001E354D34|nr:helix-turn-helix domain-containing protein [Staphylococcus simulans]MCD8914247.1 helix-turn-helix domain-containing protein [Staphylococcus simulans]